MGKVLGLTSSTAGTDADRLRLLGAWFAQPLPALGNARPSDLLDTAVGRDLIAVIIMRSALGVYS